MKNNKGFTLIEVLVGILIFSLIIIGGFYALSSVTIGKIKITEETDMEKQAFFFSEKLFEMIKAGGGIDYEEYFSRRVLENGSPKYLSGHYKKPSNFGNITYSKGGVEFYDYYYCRSGNGISMGSGGCLKSAFNNIGKDFTGEEQLYGQYKLHFIDYNSNQDDDGSSSQCGNGMIGDEDCDGNIIGDDDDEYLGVGPLAFTSNKVKEVYLISGDGKRRTYFRWNVKNDPDAPFGKSCTYGTGGEPTGEGCLGTIEFLKLDGKDWGINHSKSSGGNKSYLDGIVDTWVYNKEMYGLGNEYYFDLNHDLNHNNINVALSDNQTGKWIKIFPDYINVKDVKFYLYPRSDNRIAWNDKTKGGSISPYLRMSMILSPSWKKRRGMKGKIPEIKIATTVALTRENIR